MLHRFDVDWEAHGFDDAALDELSEFCLRVRYSFLVDRGQGPCDADALRQFLARWIAPAIIYPRFAGRARLADQSCCATTSIATPHCLLTG
jgi:hypothetical protein